MSLEKINALLSPGLSEAERLSNVKSLLERHGVLLDRIRNNTGRPKGKRPGMWPCQCYSDVKLLMGPENLEQIYDNVAQSESCHDRRSKLTMYTANNQFHSIPPQVKGAFIAQFGKELAVHSAELEGRQKRR